MELQQKEDEGESREGFLLWRVMEQPVPTGWSVQPVVCDEDPGGRCLCSWSPRLAGPRVPGGVCWQAVTSCHPLALDGRVSQSRWELWGLFISPRALPSVKAGLFYSSSAF